MYLNSNFTVFDLMSSLFISMIFFFQKKSAILFHFSLLPLLFVIFVFSSKLPLLTLNIEMLIVGGLIIFRNSFQVVVFFSPFASLNQVKFHELITLPLFFFFQFNSIERHEKK